MSAIAFACLEATKAVALNGTRSAWRIFRRSAFSDIDGRLRAKLIEGMREELRG